RFTNAIERWTYCRAARRIDDPATPATRNDAHSDQGSLLRQDVGDTRLQTTLAAVIIAFQAKRNINRNRHVELRDARRKSPPDCLELALPGGKSELEAIAADQFWRSDQANTSRDEYRRRIANSERLEVSEQS